MFLCIRKTIPFLVNLRKYKDLLDEMQVKCYTNIQRQRLTLLKSLQQVKLMHRIFDLQGIHTTMEQTKNKY